MKVFDFELVKKHPYAVGGTILVIGAIVFYLIVRRSGGSSGEVDTSGESSKLLQAQTAQQISAQQYGAQLQMQEIAGQVAAYQVQGQVAAVQTAYAAQVAIESSHDATQVAVAQIGAGSYSDYLDTQKIIELDRNATDLAIAQSHDNAAVDITGIQGATYLGVASLQADLAKYGLDKQYGYAEDLLDYNRHIADKVLTNPEFGHNYGGSSTGVTQIISALQGQGPAALASTNPGAYGGGFNIDIPGVGSVGVNL